MMIERLFILMDRQYNIINLFFVSCIYLIDTFFSLLKARHFSAELFISAVQVVKGSPGPNGETFGGHLMMEIVTDGRGERKQSVAAVVVETPENTPTEPQPLGKEMGIGKRQTHGDG
jgi:hypothetical protein